MRRRGLAVRILLLAVGLVTLTAVAAGLATVRFAGTAARAEQRGELTAQASLLRLQSARLVTPRVLRRVARRLDGTVVSVWGPDAALLSTTAAATAPVVRRARSYARQAITGGDVSTLMRVRDRDVLVEARATTDGGAIVLTRRVAPLTRAVGELTAGVLGVLALCLGLATAAALWLARRIARPLAATASAARRLAAGERGVPVPVVPMAEIEDVADGLRALDGALATSEGRQREFLLSISHELRTPLTALRGYGEALADGLVAPERTLEVGGVLVAETTRLERFTADLLELARLEADDFTIETAEVDLAAIVRDAERAWAARAEGLGVTLVASTDTSVAARADARRVRQVLDGLVENALRATPSGGAVRLKVTGAGAVATVSVEDTGPGLSDDDLANAFTRGLLRERHRESRAVGTGLGLSIATRLAGRMRGRITAAHADAGTGARFVLELPAA